MVAHTIRTIDPNVKIKEVRASRGKHVRAEPIAALYEQGRVAHVGSFPALENQMTQMTTSGFEGEGSPDRVARLIFCSGKVYYDLLEFRENNKIKNAAIIRVEQLYPLNYEMLKDIVARYPRAQKKWIWCQEEPVNQGAWYQIQHRLQLCLQPGQELGFSGRVAGSAPAGGSILLHNQREKLLHNLALGIEETKPA
jgi:2-oxoglutarate dehydrogenase complex dehydrogenase (E1) component-like enzyme